MIKRLLLGIFLLISSFNLSAQYAANNKTNVSSTSLGDAYQAFVQYDIIGNKQKIKQ